MRANMACVTNWSSFPGELKLPGCTQVLHMPVFSTKGFFDACIIFHPTPSTMGVLISHRPQPIAEGKAAEAAQDPIFGEKIM
mmetsp:Transcript_17724/g.23939  ORF Transcript_17724/g.23939 Transcript_17724/m.23939 type:complete len:82 (+) Transcript_17724:43-288(+)